MSCRRTDATPVGEPAFRSGEDDVLEKYARNTFLLPPETVSTAWRPCRGRRHHAFRCSAACRDSIPSSIGGPHLPPARSGGGRNCTHCVRRARIASLTRDCCIKQHHSNLAELLRKFVAYARLSMSPSLALACGSVYELSPSAGRRGIYGRRQKQSIRWRTGRCPEMLAPAHAHYTQTQAGEP